MPVSPTEEPQSSPPPGGSATKTLSTIWTVTGLSLFYITFNTWAHTQNAEFDLPLDLFKSFGPRAALLFAIPLCALLIATVSFVGEEHARISRGRTWRSRLPRAFGADLEVDVSSPVGRWYQRLFLFTIVIFPTGGMIHFVRRFLDTSIVASEHPGRYSVFHWDWSRPFDAMAYTFDGKSFFPAWQAWTYLILVGFATYRLARFVAALFPSRPLAGARKPAEPPFAGPKRSSSP